MDDKFQKMQEGASQHYNQGLRLKKPLTTNKDIVEKGLLHIEIKALKQQLTILNEDYEGHIEVSFNLHNKLFTLEGMLAALKTPKQNQHKQCKQMTKTIRGQQHLEARDKELALARKQIAMLQEQRWEQDEILTNIQDELRHQNHMPQPQYTQVGKQNTAYQLQKGAN